MGTRFGNRREKARLDRDIRRVAELRPLSSDTELLESEVESWSDRQLQIAMRDLAPGILTRALSGAGGGAVKRFLDNLPDRGRIMLISDILEFRIAEARNRKSAAQSAGMYLQEIREAQRTLLNALESTAPREE